MLRVLIAAWGLIMSCSGEGLGPPIAEPGDIALDAFLTWCSSNGVVMHQDIAIASSSSSHIIFWDNIPPTTKEQEERGRDVVAASDLQPRTLVATVPFRTLVNVEHALNDPALGPLFDQLYDELSDLQIMGAFLVRELHKKGGSSKSFWGPYFDIFPKHLDLPILYSNAELNELQGSWLQNKTAEERAAIEKAHTLITSTAQTKPYDLEEFLMHFSRESFFWAISILKSRTHSIAVKDFHGVWHNVMCLVPIADMFNTALNDSQINVACYTDEDGVGLDSVFRCETTQHISKGEKLLTSYISRPERRVNARMLSEYGFVPSSGGNPHDAVLLPLPSFNTLQFQHTILLHLRLDKLREVAARFDIEKNSDSLPSLPILTLFRVHCLKVSDIESLEGALSRLALGKRISLENELCGVHEFLGWLQDRLSQYPTSVQEDTSMLENLSHTSASIACDQPMPSSPAFPACQGDTHLQSRRYRDILNLRVSEKRILLDLIQFYTDLHLRLTPGLRSDMECQNQAKEDQQFLGQAGSQLSRHQARSNRGL